MPVPLGFRPVLSPLGIQSSATAEARYAGTTQAFPPLRTHAASHDPWVFPLAQKRVGRKRLPRSDTKPDRHAMDYGYLLVLVAEQEVGAGREAQAQCLLDAAYAAFDGTLG